MDRLCHTLITSGIDVRQAGATAWANVEHDCHVWLFPLRGFLHPPKGISSWPYTWCHATDLKGLLGMMSVGKVLRSATGQVGLDPSSGQYSFRFFAKVCDKQPWSDDWKHWVSGASHSTKNQDDVLLLGFLETVHHKAPSANTSHENNLTRLYALVHSPAADRRWAVREAAARLDCVAICSKSQFSYFSRADSQPSFGTSALPIQNDNWGRWTPNGPRHRRIGDAPVFFCLVLLVRARSLVCVSLCFYGLHCCGVRTWAKINLSSKKFDVIAF